MDRPSAYQAPNGASFPQSTASTPSKAAYSPSAHPPLHYDRGSFDNIQRPKLFHHFSNPGDGNPFAGVSSNEPSIPMRTSLLTSNLREQQKWQQSDTHSGSAAPALAHRFSQPPIASSPSCSQSFPNTHMFPSSLPARGSDYTNKPGYLQEFTPFIPNPLSNSFGKDQPEASQSFTQFGSFPQPAASMATTNISTDNAFSNTKSETLASLTHRDSITGLEKIQSENHLDLANHSVDDLLLMLSALLQKIVEANDLLHPEHYTNTWQQQQRSEQIKDIYTANVLAFHGRNVPAISLHAYLTRILKYCPVTNEVFLSLLVYFDRIAKRANVGEFSGDDPQGSNQLFVMDSYNIHRLIIAGVTVASKFFSDVFYKNSRYAKVGGLPLDELNYLEVQFLLLLDFELMVQIEEMTKYGDLLLKFWKREQVKLQQSSTNTL